MAKNIADKTPMVEAARVRVSCSFTRRLGIDLKWPSHSGFAGVRVFEPGVSRAIHGGRHAQCVFARSNV